VGKAATISPFMVAPCTTCGQDIVGIVNIAAGAIPVDEKRQPVE
jgi:hypothetical protein